MEGFSRSKKNKFVILDGVYAINDIDTSTLNEAIRVSKNKAVIFVSSEEFDIRLRERYENQEDIGNIVSTISVGDMLENIEPGDLLDENDSSPVINLVNTILSDAVIKKSSDVHIEPYEKYTNIRFRIDGKLVEVCRIDGKISNFINARIKVISGLNIAEKRKPQDGRVRLQISGHFFDMRVSFMPSAYGERCVMRILDNSNRQTEISKIGMGKEMVEWVKKTASMNHGMFLVSGPTGSGKSTSIYSILNYLKDPKLNILSIEDPVEYNIDGIGQMQVDNESGITFSTGLRSILRQDPDVILVGEIRDEETARMAIQASLTGHMVFSTIHTNTAVGTISRLRDLNIEPYLISSSIKGIVSQRLVRKLCTCATDNVEKVYVNEGLSVISKKNANGCEKCNDSGYLGRTGVFEYIEITEQIKEAIHDEKDEDTIIKMGNPNGIIRSCIGLVESGITSLEEVLPIITNT